MLHANEGQIRANGWREYKTSPRFSIRNVYRLSCTCRHTVYNLSILYLDPPKITKLLTYCSSQLSLTLYEHLYSLITTDISFRQLHLKLITIIILTLIIIPVSLQFLSLARSQLRSILHAAVGYVFIKKQSVMFIILFSALGCSSGCSL